jgi:hypothetical protein
MTGQRMAQDLRKVPMAQHPLPHSLLELRRLGLLLAWQAEMGEEWVVRLVSLCPMSRRGALPCTSSKCPRCGISRTVWMRPCRQLG